MEFNVRRINSSDFVDGVVERRNDRKQLYPISQDSTFTTFGFMREAIVSDVYGVPIYLIRDFGLDYSISACKKNLNVLNLGFESKVSRLHVDKNRYKLENTKRMKYHFHKLSKKITPEVTIKKKPRRDKILLVYKNNNSVSYFNPVPILLSSHQNEFNKSTIEKTISQYTLLQNTGMENSSNTYLEIVKKERVFGKKEYKKILYLIFNNNIYRFSTNINYENIQKPGAYDIRYSECGDESFYINYLKGLYSEEASSKKSKSLKEHKKIKNDKIICEAINSFRASVKENISNFAKKPKVKYSLLPYYLIRRSDCIFEKYNNNFTLIERIVKKFILDDFYLVVYSISPVTGLVKKKRIFYPDITKTEKYNNGIICKTSVKIFNKCKNKESSCYNKVLNIFNKYTDDILRSNIMYRTDNTCTLEHKSPGWLIKVNTNKSKTSKEIKAYRLSDGMPEEYFLSIPERDKNSIGMPNNKPSDIFNNVQCCILNPKYVTIGNGLYKHEIGEDNISSVDSIFIETEIFASFLSRRIFPLKTLIRRRCFSNNPLFSIAEMS